MGIIFGGPLEDGRFANMGRMLGFVAPAGSSGANTVIGGLGGRVFMPIVAMINNIAYPILTAMMIGKSRSIAGQLLGT
jgi:hypothetical protein